MVHDESIANTASRPSPTAGDRFLLSRSQTRMARYFGLEKVITDREIHQYGIDTMHYANWHKSCMSSNRAVLASDNHLVRGAMRKRARFFGCPSTPHESPCKEQARARVVAPRDS